MKGTLTTIAPTALIFLVSESRNVRGSDGLFRLFAIVTHPVSNRSSMTIAVPFKYLNEGLRSIL